MFAFMQIGFGIEMLQHLASRGRRGRSRRSHIHGLIHGTRSQIRRISLLLLPLLLLLQRGKGRCCRRVGLDVMLLNVLLGRRRPVIERRRRGTRSAAARSLVLQLLLQVLLLLHQQSLRKRRRRRRGPGFGGRRGESGGDGRNRRRNGKRKRGRTSLAAELD